MVATRLWRGACALGLAVAFWSAWGVVLVDEPAQAATPCAAALCVLDPTDKDALRAQPGTIAVAGSILVNSTNNEAALASGESGTATVMAIGTIGGPAAPAGFVVKNNGSFRPSPVNQPAGTDPYAALPMCPAATACPTTPTPPFPSVSLTSGSQTINPGA